MTDSPGTVWPWLAETPSPLPPTLPNGRSWPRISIVTPSYNQGRYIEEAILSIANQGYDNVEHIVMDGGSKDGTVQILERHGSKLAYWESQPDRGQSHAINKGFARATGEILTWLNSDDRLAPGALAAVALSHDMTGADLFAGICELFDENGAVVNHLTSCASAPLSLADFLDDEFLREGWSFYQPEVMFTRALWDRTGARVDQDLHYVMDYDLWLRFAAADARLQVLGRPIAQFRFHKLQKTGQIPTNPDIAARHAAEVKAVRERFAGRSSRPSHFPHRHEARPRKDRITIDCVGGEGLRYETRAAQRRAMETFALAGHDVRIRTHRARGIFAAGKDSIAAADTAELKPDLALTLDAREAEKLGLGPSPLLVVKPTRTDLIIRDSAEPPALRAVSGFPTHQFRPRNKAELRRKLGLPGTGKVIAVRTPLWSRLDPAFRQVVHLARSLERTDVTLVALGGAAVGCLGLRHVVATGAIESEARMADWLSAADIYIAMSNAAAAQTAVEAALCGVPCVAYRHPDLQSAIIDGVSGILVEAGDQHGLKQAVSRLLNDGLYRQSLSSWGRTAMESSRSYAAGYHAVHRALLETGILQVWRDQVWVRFDPIISAIWTTPSSVAAAEAYRPIIANGRMLLRAPPPAGAPAKESRLFLALRAGVRGVFPRQRPAWIKRIGSLIPH